MARHTTFRIGGPADAYVVVSDAATLARCIEFCRKQGVEMWLLGRGSNVLVSDQGLRGAVVTLRGELAAVEAAGSSEQGAVALRIGAGAAMDEVATFAEANGLVGAAFLAGIPGTIGGGLCSNAGAFGGSLSDIVAGVSGVTVEGESWSATRECVKRGYRESLIPADVIATSVVLSLARGTPEPAADIRERRRARHPNQPSAGSFFKNPVVAEGAVPDSGHDPKCAEHFGHVPSSRIPAGRVIEECGFKGRAIGGAQVSEKHANFIVNTGRATFGDVYELAQVVKAGVEQATGILLSEEVQILPGARR